MGLSPSAKSVVCPLTTFGTKVDVDAYSRVIALASISTFLTSTKRLWRNLMFMFLFLFILLSFRYFSCFLGYDILAIHCHS